MPRRVTADDVARAVGVSRSTVSFVLNDTPGQTISPSVQQRVRAEAERLGYRPHPHARALASGQSHIVLMVMPRWPVEYVMREMLDEASAALDDAGYSLVTMDAYRHGHATPLWQTLRPDIVISVDPLEPSQVKAIKRAGVNYLPPGPAGRPGFDIGPELQITHLIDRGHRSIAYASTSVGGMEAMDIDRLERIREVAELADVKFATHRISVSNAADVVRLWTDQGVTGVAAFNDDTAAQVIGGAARLGITVPASLAIVGHDDSPIASMVYPTISTIRLDIAGLGRHFAERALAAARGEPAPPSDAPGVRARLIVRESS